MMICNLNLAKSTLILLATIFERWLEIYNSDIFQHMAEYLFIWVAAPCCTFFPRIKKLTGGVNKKQNTNKMDTNANEKSGKMSTH